MQFHRPTSNAELANCFASFFDAKIIDLLPRIWFYPTICIILYIDIPRKPISLQRPSLLLCLRKMSTKYLNVSLKSSDHDYLPTKLFRQCQEELLHVITEIINIFLTSGVVPSTFKSSRIGPLLKSSPSFLFWRKLHFILNSIIDQFSICHSLQRFCNHL